MWTCGTQGHKRNTQTEGYVTTEAEIGAIPPPVKECQEPQETGRDKEGISSRSFGGNMAPPHLDLDY